MTRTSAETLIQRIALGITLPVMSYVALAVLTFSDHEGTIVLAGGAWCAIVWACYRLALWLRVPSRSTKRAAAA